MDYPSFMVTTMHASHAPEFYFIFSKIGKKGTMLDVIRRHRYDINIEKNNPPW